MGFIGRQAETAEFDAVMDSSRAEFMALYGRRRVGKTYLVREYFKNRGCYFELTGIKNGSLSDQLLSFKESFQNLFYPSIPLSVPGSWHEALDLLTREIVKTRNRKIIVFLDELPWLAGPHSGFLEQLDYFWNRHWVSIKNLVVIVCGSAASWMLDNLIYNKGGLHNRLTKTMRLMPFTLSETKEFLNSKKIPFTNRQILELTMTFGGVPYYLDQIKRGDSVAQNIHRLCFSKDGLLADEFHKLFSSLFHDAEKHRQLVEVLARHRYGMTRETLLKTLKLKTGGRVHKRLRELEEAGFITQFLPLGRKKDPRLCVIDEFCLFYLQWMSNLTKGVLGRQQGNLWLKFVGKPAWHAWSGMSFESVCYKHIGLLARKMGLEQTGYQVGTWWLKAVPKLEKPGVQIDLVIDRDDDVTTLCEMKFTKNPLLVDARMASDIERKKRLYREFFKVEKQVLFALITNQPVKPNPWSKEVVDQTVVLTELY